MTADVTIEGMIAIRAAIEGQNRDIHMVYMQKNKEHRALRSFLSLLHSKNIEHQYQSAEFIGQLAAGNTHGGFVALAGKRRYMPLCELFENGKKSVFFALDGIEDPYNYGYCIRSLYASGVDGIVVSDRDWHTAEGIVIKSSAGTSELMPTAKMDDPDIAASEFARRGLHVFCAAKSPEAASLHDIRFPFPAIVVIGGEKRGISKIYMQHAESLVKIPYVRTFRFSLTTCSAASIFAYEIMRQANI